MKDHLLCLNEINLSIIHLKIFVGILLQMKIYLHRYVSSRFSVISVASLLLEDEPHRT